MAFMGERTPARALFRKLALGMAVVCVVLAAAFGVAPGVKDRLMGVGVCLFLGFVMLAIGTTGDWPPRRGWSPPRDGSG